MLYPLWDGANWCYMQMILYKTKQLIVATFYFCQISMGGFVIGPLAFSMKFKVYVKNFVLTYLVWSTMLFITIYPHNSKDIMISDKWDLQLKHGHLEKDNFNSSESTGSRRLPESVKRKYCEVTLYKYQIVSLAVNLAWLEDVNS